MESTHDIIPFAKEMLSQKPNRGMVKVYVVGTVLAFFGVVIGLVETVCQSFAPREPMEEELPWLIARERHPPEHKQTSVTTETGAVSKQQVAAVQRNTATRLHAS